MTVVPVYFRVRRHTGELTHMYLWKWGEFDEIASDDYRGMIEYNSVSPFEEMPIIDSTLYFSDNIDISRGYVIEVTRAYVRGGKLSQASTSLTTATAVGDTTLTIVDSVGFRAGDTIYITDSLNAAQTLKVKSITRKVITLYPDHALKYVFAASSVVKNAMFYTALGRYGPAPLPGWNQVALQSRPVTIDQLVAF